MATLNPSNVITLPKPAQAPPLPDEGLTAEYVRALDVQGEFWMTEQGVALDFAEKNADRLRFIAEDRCWIAWTGTHWSESCAATLAERFYSELVGGTLKRAAEATSDKQRDALIARAQLMGKRGMRSNALALAQPNLMVSREAFDRDAADLLNTPSGTVDLRTGEVSPCDPARLLTQCTAIAYDPEAPEPERFLELVWYLAGQDEGAAEWLLRALGYSITGHVYEDLVFFLRGRGSNGKSTLLKAVGNLLGDYAHPLDIRFLTAGGDGGHSTDYAVLRNKRFVTSTEVNKGQRLSTSRMKDLSGGDLSAHRDIREKAKDARKVAPNLKLWLFGNHDLVVPGNDDATWRRLIKIASDHKFKRSAVRDSLAATEGAGILRVLVEAAAAWYRGGSLGDLPATVARATEQYRAEQDLLGKFFRDCLAFDADSHVSKAALTQAYRDWLAEEGGDHRVGPRELAQRLAEHGATEGRTKLARIWKGVRLRESKDDGARQPRARVAGKFARPQPPKDANTSTAPAESG